MADFNISIPQPNTGAFGGNLLQGLSAIEGIKAARAQQEQASMMAPLQLQAAQLGIQSQQQQMEQSAAAARRAAFGFNQQLQALQAEKQRKTQVGTAFDAFLKAEDAGVDAIAPAMGILNKDEFKDLQAAAQVRLAQIIGKMDPENPQPELVKQFGQLSAMLPPEEGKRFDAIRNALPNKYREGLSSTLNDAALFGLAGENDKALKLMDDQIEAFGKDQNPAAQAMAKELQTVRSRLNEDTKPAVWANSFYGNALRSGDSKMAEAALNFLKERAPEQVAKTESETSLKKAETRLKELEADLKESGALDPEKKMSKEMQMQDAFESEPLVKKYIERRDILNAVQLAKKEKTPVSDAAAITAVVKINDPTSTVSVTESGQVVGGTLPQQFRSFVARLSGDGKLSEKDRDDLIRYAETRTKSSENEYNTYLKKNIAIAKRRGLDPENIFFLPDAPTQSVLGNKAPQTREEQLKGKSVPPPAPTGAWRSDSTSEGVAFKVKPK
jgi:hypothetical protein